VSHQESTHTSGLADANSGKGCDRRPQHELARRAEPTNQDLFESRLGPQTRSKLANLLFVLELQRRLTDAGSTVRAIAAHPGYAATNLQGRTASPISNFFAAVANRLVAKSDTMGALPTLYAATADIPGGTYIGRDGFRHIRGPPRRQHPRLAGPRRRDVPSPVGAVRAADRRVVGFELPYLHLSLPGRGRRRCRAGHIRSGRAPS
jgi:NAD(P)-dependent dehydrogenase (short-subunit alcohol dehydrogenase family)